MAALMRHGVLEIVHGKAAPGVTSIPMRLLQLGRPPPLARPPLARQMASKADKKKGIDRKVPPRIDSTAQAIAAKGFLRPQRGYAVPEDVDARLDAVFEQLGAKDLTDLAEKFSVCKACAEEFDHPIPNSLLYKMQTLNDVREFYKTPVDVKTPLDKMRNMDLPENLHVQFEYHRFHPETDKMFGGQTAFNRSSTLVTGLKYKDKYKGHIQNTQWPFNS